MVHKLKICLVKHFLGVSSRDAESGSLLSHFRRRESDTDGRNLSFEEADNEGRDLRHHEDHQRNNGAIVVAVDDKTHLNKAFPNLKIILV